MLYLAVCFAAGILIAGRIPPGLDAAAIGTILLALAALFYRKHFAGTVFVMGAFAAAGAFAFAAANGAVRADRVKLLYDSGTVASGSPVEVEGILAGRPEPSIDGELLTLRVENLTARRAEYAATGNVRVFVPMPDTGSGRSSGPSSSEAPLGSRSSDPDSPNFKSQISDLRSQIPNLKYGSRIRVACTLEREDEYLNPGVQTKRELLDRLDIDATCPVKSPLLIEHIADESVFVPLAWVYDQRGRLIDAFHANLSPKAAGVMIASLLGNKYFLDKETADLFRDGGTFHILVISGLHITFIGGLLLLLIRRLTRNRWLQFVLTASALWAYTLAVGADVPVVRAAIMFTIILFSHAIYRSSELLNSLGFCGLVLLAWRPADLVNPSFQLTFVSVAAIIGCGYPLIEHLRSIGDWRPSPSTPFPPNVAGWLRRSCETLYWDADAWEVEAKRLPWTARFVKSPYMARRSLRVIQKVVRYVFEAMVISLIVQLWMLPLTIVYFHRVSVASIFLNLWVGALITLESFAALAGAAAGKVSELLGAGFYAIADAANWLMLSLPRLLSDGGWASFRLPAYSGNGSVIYAAYFIPLVFIAYAITRWRPFSLKQGASFGNVVLTGALFSTAVLVVIMVVHPLSVPSPDGRLHIDFLDVGQGDSALITFPNGETMLVDGGGRANYRDSADQDGDAFVPDSRGIGEAVVSQVLWEKGYSHIDHILATHADADHVQGLVDVAKNFAVGSAIFGRMPPDDPDLAELTQVLNKRRNPAEIVARGDVFTVGGVRIEVLSPAVTDDPASASGNNTSVVLRLLYGTRSFLLTGDIERAAEAELLANSGTVSADVIKVPHHGSRTSSTPEFVDAVKPQYAVISVGRRSQFGHPNADVVERWRLAGANVMATGERGMISISTDGRDLEIKRFVH